MRLATVRVTAGWSVNRYQFLEHKCLGIEVHLSVRADRDVVRKGYRLNQWLAVIPLVGRNQPTLNPLRDLNYPLFRSRKPETFERRMRCIKVVPITTLNASGSPFLALAIDWISPLYTTKFIEIEPVEAN